MHHSLLVDRVDQESTRISPFEVKLILGSESNGVTLWSFEPIDGGFELVREAAIVPEAPTFPTPAVLDLEHDGDPDLFVGGIGGGVVLYENLVR